jgi:VanZ family protein
VSCKHSWQGDVYGLAVYKYSLTDSAVARHYESWVKSKNFSFAEKEAPFLLYLFDEKTGTRAIDHAGGNRHLNMPPTTKVLERRFLLPPRNGIDVDTLISKDVIINLMGFGPLGFVLCATMAKFRGIFRKYDVLIALVVCFGVSLIIEIAQAWIPSRNSDLLDLVFNTIGGLIGAVAYLTISNRIGTAIDQ